MEEVSEAEGEVGSEAPQEEEEGLEEVDLGEGLTTVHPDSTITDTLLEEASQTVLRRGDSQVPQEEVGTAVAIATTQTGAKHRGRTMIPTPALPPNEVDTRLPSSLASPSCSMYLCQTRDSVQRVRG